MAITAKKKAERKEARSFKARQQFIIDNSIRHSLISPFLDANWDHAVLMYVDTGDKSYLVNTPLAAKMDEAP